MKNIAKILCFVLSLVLIISVMGVSAFADETAAEPTGNLSAAYTGADRIWGECSGNAKESFVIKVYSDETYLGSSSLNNVDGIIDGDVTVTWSVKLNGESSDYWTVEWEWLPASWLQPTRVEQWVDGVKVAEAPIQLNGPDGLNKIVAAAVDAEYNITRYYTKLADALNDGAKRVLLLADTKENISSISNVELFTTVDAGVTVTSTYTDNYVDFDNVTIGYGVTLNAGSLYSGGSYNNIEGAVNVTGNYVLGYDATASVSGSLTVGGELSIANNLDSYSGLSVGGEVKCGTLALHSGSVSGYGVTLVCDKFVADNVNDIADCAGISASIFDGAIIAGEVAISDDVAYTLNALKNDDGTYTIIVPVAMVNGVCYPTLQAAINACVKGDNVVTLLVDDLDETVTIKQYAGINVVIDGAGHTFTGSFLLNGNSRYTGKETLTIKNINFYTYNDVHYFINYAVSKSYVHNLLVEDCTFEGYGENNTVCCVVLRQANGVTVRNCTATNVFNLLNNTSGGQNIKVEGCYVDGQYGIRLNNAGGTNSVTDSTINATTGYAISIQVNGNKASTTIDGNTVENGYIGIQGGNVAYDVVLTSNNEVETIKVSNDNDKLNVKIDDGFEFVGKADGSFGMTEVNQLPIIGENGNWWIGTVDTGYKAVPSIEVVDGEWVINGLPTGIRAEAINGHSPVVSIGEDGFWYIDDVNTEIRAQAIDGVGIAKIEKSDALSSDNVSSYVITFTDGTIFTFTVTNGLNGSQGETGHVGPQGDKGATGDKGIDGLDGEDGSDVLKVAIIIAGAGVLLALVVLGARIFKKDPFALPF